MKVFSTILVVLFFQALATSQVALPYYSGFDNSAELDGWTEYKTASTEFSNWGIASAYPFSVPNNISHSYSPSTGITLTDNWFVSPGFSLESGGTLDSIRYRFSGFSVPDVGDTIGVYVLNGSQNPELASSVELLIDFRGDDYVNRFDFEYEVKTGVPLSAYSGMSYIGIRYRNTDCSSKWLAVAFDNVAVNGIPLSTKELIETDFRVFPNPATESVTISGNLNVHTIKIFNTLGQLVYSNHSFGNQAIFLAEFDPGLYIMKIETNNTEYSQKLIIQ